jgi:hypothetical protein
VPQFVHCVGRIRPGVFDYCVFFHLEQHTFPSFSL